MPEPVSAAIGGAALLGTGAQIYGANQAANAQKKAANRAADTQMAMFERQLELQAPFREAGLTAQNRLLTLLGLGADPNAADFGKYARDFGMKDFQTDPGYGFRLNEGMKALERSAAARGGLLSGSALKGSQQFGQDLASQEYMNAFNRYQTNRAAQLNPLQSLMGAGQTSANVLTGAAGETGRGVAGAQMGAGAASAGGYMGMASALNQGLSTGANLYMQAPLYNAMAQYYSRPNYGLVSGANIGGPGGY